ncbi:DEAD/DEAH box helicase [Aquipuribacter hungaricus]|uniref:DEAD/DEAH box helicase n=2 Tax=Aquipuribacter hungaricus TaxID=545624 RepID=A0ABV7WIX0_9MICO
MPGTPLSATPESQPTPGFDALGVSAPLVAALSAQGITAPFPIQTATLPDSMAGRDVLGRGRTGSGKTLAFALPIVSRLLSDTTTTRTTKRPRALVLAPTRELATQIAEVLRPLAETNGLTVTTVFGGVPQGRQTQALSRGVDIVIACPGRLEDLMGQREVFLDQVRITVLDEADHMADLGFLPAVTRILDATPAGIQRMLFSATLDNGVDRLVRRYLRDPRTHSVDSAESPVSTMTHRLLSVSDATAKSEVVRELASGTGRRVLFMRTKHSAKKLAKQLIAAGIPSVDLHGNLTQGARQRNLTAFSEGEVNVLVATDVAARGIHVDDVELVVHVDPPTEHKAYLHRSGRTARAGSEGTVVTVVLPEQEREVTTLMRQAKVTPRKDRVQPGSPVVAELVGEVAPKREYTSPAEKMAALQGETGTGRRATGRSRRSGAQAGSSTGGRSGGSGRAPSSSGGSGRGATASSGGTARPATGYHGSAHPGGGHPGGGTGGTGGTRRRGGSGRPARSR